MYKKQLRIQKIVCFAAIVLAVVFFIYGLGILTDMHDSLKDTIRNIDKPERDKVPGARIYYDMQDFNKDLVNYSVILILLACFLFVMNTHSRRKYYIGNYVAIGAYCVGALALTVWSHLRIEAYKNQFLTTVDFEALKEYSEQWGTLYLDNTNLLDLHYAVSAMAVLVVAGLVVNTVWKLRLMKNETELIKAGEEAAV